MCSTGCDHKAAAYANPLTIINECSIVPTKDVRKNIANGSDVTSAVIASNGVRRNGTPTALRNGVSNPHHGVSVNNGVKTCNNGLERNSLLCGLIDGDLSEVPNQVSDQTVQSVALDALDTTSEGRVLVMYTGGTIGMVKDRSGALAPLPNALEKRLRESPILHDAEYARSRYGRDGPLVLPPSGDSRRVVYTIKEYNPLLDSSNMCVQDWVKIATDIKKHYKEYDGFVILHGTDTLAYTSSALSFMLENLGKTVVVTGSQIPLWELRSDGRDNLILSLVIAGCYVVPEVTVLFGSRLLRGNRTVKVSSDKLAAFDSPNLPPLATIGIDIKVDYHMISQPGSLPFTVHAHMSDDIGLIRIFPNISNQTIKSFLQPPLRGAVLLTYGAGNIPSRGLELLNELRAASNRGVILVNCTQCPSGRVADLYATGKALDGIGVVSGADMTPEAALCKLAYVITKEEWDVETKKEMLRTSLRGELTPTSPCPLKECSTLDGMVRALHLQMPQTVAILMPALTCAAAARPGASALAALIDAGAVVTACTTEQRTPLHVAAAEGNVAAVRLLLQHGASVHAKDRFGRTPLLDAVVQDRHDVINELRDCGAHLYGALSRFADKICSVAAQGDVRRLKSFHLAGVDLGQRDSSGRTALHAAAETGQCDAVRFLLSAGVHQDGQDADGRTAADLARLRGHQELEGVLKK